MTTTVLAYFPSPGQGVWYLGPVPIRAYALCIIAGIIAALVIGDRRWVARGGERGVIYDIALWAVPFGLIGGRIYHLLTDWQTYFGPGGAGPMAALRIWEGGLGIWGAVAFGGVGAWIACRRRGIPLPAFGDAVAPGIVLAQAIGRLGNYFNQELYGRETTVPWGMEIFYRRDPSGLVDVHSLDGVSTGQVAAVVHPTFLYELLWNLLVFFFLLWADRRFRLGHGRLFALYVASYCVGRFWVELLRDDTATHIAGIRINVFTATFVFIGAVVYLLLAPKGREDPASLQGYDEVEEESAVEEFAEELVSSAAGSGILAATTGGGILAAATVAGEHEYEDAIAAGDEQDADVETADETDDSEDGEEFVAAVESEEMAAEAELEQELVDDDLAEADADADAAVVDDTPEGPIVVYPTATEAATVVIYASEDSETGDAAPEEEAEEPQSGDSHTESDADLEAAPAERESESEAEPEAQPSESDVTAAPDGREADADEPDDDGSDGTQSDHDTSESAVSDDAEPDDGEPRDAEPDDAQPRDAEIDDAGSDDADDVGDGDGPAEPAAEQDREVGVEADASPAEELSVGPAPAAGNAGGDATPRLGSSLRRLLFGGRGRN